jgi:hypothetical protein
VNFAMANGIGERDPPEDFTLAELADVPELEPVHRPRVDADGLIRSHSQQQPTFKDDFVLTAEDTDTTDYEKLQPPEGLSPGERRMMCAEPAPVVYIEEPERPLWQFTTLEMFWLMSFMSVGFAIMYYLPPAEVAGVLGLLALGGQFLLMRFPPDSRHVRLGAYTLLIMYVCAAAVAFVVHTTSG